MDYSIYTDVNFSFIHIIVVMIQYAWAMFIFSLAAIVYSLCSMFTLTIPTYRQVTQLVVSSDISISLL